MRKKNNTYIEQLRKKQAASRQAPQPKPVSEMSAQELAAEEQRLHQQVRHHREQAVEAGREAVAETGGSSLAAFLSSRRKARRAPWK
jgi:hypothetical protein